MSRFKTTIRVIIMERDTDDPFRGDGAIIMEQYTKLDDDAVEDRAQSLADGGKYGRIWVGEINTAEVRHIAPLKEPKDSVVELMRVARCPDEDCGGKGYTVQQITDDDAWQVPCQWCAERQQILDDAAAKLPF